MNGHGHLAIGTEGSRRPRAASQAALLALLLLVQLATSLYQLPLVRLVERRLCNDYYAKARHPQHGTGIDENLCKVDEVQQDLAWILGAMETAWIVGDFVMAIPLGFIAEKYGQKVVLWLNLTPRLFMLAWAPIVGLGLDEILPISTVILGPCLSFLGGDCVFGSITYSLAAGSTDNYVTRASLFGYMSSVSYVTNLLGPGLASVTMGTTLWLPFVIGICLLLLAVPAINLLPNTTPRFSSGSMLSSSGDAGEVEEEQQSLLPSSPLLKAARNTHATSTPSTTLTTIHSIWSRSKAHIYSLQSAIFPSSESHHSRQVNSQNLPLLLASFFLTSLASSDTKLLPQYISKRYGWRLAEVGYLLSCKAIINFVLLVFIVPRLLERSRGHDDTDYASHNYDSFQADRDRRNSVTQAGLDAHFPPPALSSSTNSKDETRTNISHARTCLGLSLLGAVLIASAGSITFLLPALGTYALGSALPVFTLSMLKSPYIVPNPASPPTTHQEALDVENHPSMPSSSTRVRSDSQQTHPGEYHDVSHTNTYASTATAETQLFALVMMTKTLGSLLGAPLMATLWVRGISFGNGALGIPYLVSAACYAAALGVFAFIQI